MTASIKVALFGAQNTGKSTLTRMLANSEPELNRTYITTVGVDYRVKYLEGDIRYKIALWDLAGLIRFESLLSEYIKMCDTIVLCFTQDDSLNYDRVKYFFCHYNDILDGKRFIIVETKVDKFKQMNMVSNRAKEFSMNLGIKFLRTSSKDGTGVDELMEFICESIEKRVPPPPPKPKQKCNIL